MIADVYMKPGGLRLRSLEPIVDRSGACPLLMDVERSCLIEVPDEYRFHMASALETGDLDEELVGWLAEQDLLTHEVAPPAVTRPAAVESPFDREGFVRVELYPRRIECYVAGLPPAGCANLEALLVKGDKARERVFFIGYEKPVEDFFALESLISALRRRAQVAVSFHVTIAVDTVSPPVAALLARLGVRLTVRCEAQPSPTVQRSLDLLRSRLDHVPVIEVSLRPEDRLRDIWRWLQRAGGRRIAVRWLDDGRFVAPWDHAEALRHYEQDVFEICDEIQAMLEDAVEPVLYQPVARLVEILISAGPVGCCSGSVAWLRDGKMVPMLDGPISAPSTFAELLGDRDDAGASFPHVDMAAAVLLFHQLRKADPESFLGFPLGDRPAARRSAGDAGPHHDSRYFF